MSMYASSDGIKWDERAHGLVDKKKKQKSIHVLSSNFISVSISQEKRTKIPFELKLWETIAISTLEYINY
jgi:hypothetical protein